MLGDAAVGDTGGAVRRHAADVELGAAADHRLRIAVAEIVDREERVARTLTKGTVYFSPLVNGDVEKRRGIKRKFYNIKTRSRLPTYLYLIQRL